jgi:peptidyl-dipeptidase Dcp
LTFSNHVLAETNAYKLVIEDKADLSGLPAAVIQAAAERATAEQLDGKWLFTLHKPSLIPFLQFSDRRPLREKLFKAYIHLGDNDNEADNKEVVRQLVNYRWSGPAVGIRNYAEYVLEENMAKTPEGSTNS